jgi:O-antigen ligase
LSIALLLTVTRASWLSFLFSVGVMTLVGVGRRRALLAVALGALLVIPAGLYVLQQKRQVGFFDRRDGSISWRETVYREGLELLVKKPRHLIVGVGMDSIKRHWREWGLFDNGRLPFGHLHSTPLQLAVERGLPVLSLWLALVFIYARMLWRLWRTQALQDWRERGIALGALGALIGFCASGIVHYNLGDSEVAMVFYLLMGMALAVERFARQESHIEAS